MRPALFIIAVTLSGLLTGCGEPPPPPPPPQPVAFSHKVHAGVNQIGCGTCHAYAAHGPIAGIPSAARCVGCHKFVDKDRPEIQKVNQAFEDGKPLVWNRVYRVPDHVYFTHERHIAAGLQCQQCHGAVEEADVLKRESPLTMGWCLNCHHARSAPTDCLTCHK
jgi:hypothetical protein